MREWSTPSARTLPALLRDHEIDFAEGVVGIIEVSDVLIRPRMNRKGGGSAVEAADHCHTSELSGREGNIAEVVDRMGTGVQIAAVCNWGEEV